MPEFLLTDAEIVPVKGSLPIRTVAVMLVGVMFAAIFFAAVSNGIDVGVDELKDISEENTEDFESDGGFLFISSTAFLSFVCFLLSVNFNFLRISQLIYGNFN